MTDQPQGFDDQQLKRLRGFGLTDDQIAMMPAGESIARGCQIFMNGVAKVMMAFQPVCPTGLLVEMKRMIDEGPFDNPFVVVDGGGGAGALVDELLWSYYKNSFGDEMRRQLRGVLVDLNPLPRFRNELGSAEEKAKYGVPDVECRQGDVQDLKDFPDELVNLYVLFGVAHYVDDLLAVISEAWRVLKDGGLMLMNFDTRLATDPPLQEILKEIDPEGRIFTVGYSWQALMMSEMTGEEPTSVVMALRKVPGVELNIPYKFTGSRVPEVAVNDVAKVGEYERC